MRSMAAILLSRQPLRPSLADNWVRRTIEAIEWLKTNNLTLCTSVGMQTWELITALGSLNAVPIEIFVPIKHTDDFEVHKAEILNQFDLRASITNFVAVTDDMSPIDDSRTLQLVRDRAVINRASVLVPVSVRPGGQMQRLLSSAAGTDSEVNRQFEIGYETRKEPLGYTLAASGLNPRLKSVGDYVTHWTRASNSPWPTEKFIDYYRAVIKSDRYPRTAFDSLRNIMRLKVIKASSNHMPDKTATVSFSDRSPDKLLELIKWRARYTQMSFEPYGVGIRKRLARDLGVHPVVYYDKKSNNSATDGVPEWLTQSLGTKTDWSIEHEYRSLGDFNLEIIPEDDLVLFCRTEREAEALSSETAIETIPFVRS